ncbi:hypothetical protein [Niabella beijingensis]|uniref:hypothetical protein n=1 Tax=Niabella beijingensis TaxID=2872700 RepID=UPI001CBBB028|nr:hypothetical protein [Niabella beijingensis]MBZ4190767.1 hypothetical protein [Niabella beijingensis]
MRRKRTIDIICILLAITAVVMIYLGISAGILPPTVTGIGFFLIIWAFQIFRKDLR